MKAVVFSVIGLILLGCTGGDDVTDGEKPVFQDQTFLLIDSGTLSFQDTKVNGSGKIGLESPLGEAIQSGRKIVTSFQLVDGGQLVFHAYSDRGLQNGLDIVFLRKGSEIEAKLELAGKESSIPLGHHEDEEHEDEEHESTIDGTGTISLKIDIHNNENPAHIIIWHADSNEVLFNSDEGSYVTGNGAGTYLGMTFDKASLLSLKLEDASDEDEIGDHQHE